MTIEYSILDPTGNITALVETPVAVPEQGAAAAEIMRRHPAVEQVGFVCLQPEKTADILVPENGKTADAFRPDLRMAGGEFCGNASMSAAALYQLRRSAAFPDAPVPRETEVTLRVSGTVHPVKVALRRETKDSFYCGVTMPPAENIEMRTFAFEGRRAELPLVRMQGISHLIIENTSAFFALKQDRGAAENAVRIWCGALGAAGLGLMFYEGAVPEEEAVLTPLVYIPEGETIFWENSCASGSAAAGMYLTQKKGLAGRLTLREPGGVLSVHCSPPEHRTVLYGRVRLTGTYSMTV